MILTNFYNQKPKATVKIIIQIITILIIADLIWIILYSGAWDHNSENTEKDKKANNENEFWESLWFIHKIVYFLAYIELILKCFLFYYLIADFKEKYKLVDLLNLNYDDGSNIILNPGSNNEDNADIDNYSLRRYANESNNSYAEDFVNKY
jgi:hypothetical protein